jgi:mediator of RNA polymerase II transcription subunit 12
LFSSQNIGSSLTISFQALYPSNEPPVSVPPVLPDILLLAQNTGPEAPSILANSLWYKYRTSPDWAWKVCDNTVASLRQIPAMISDVVGRRACALRYANFLYHVDQHLPDSLDKHILNWLLGPGKHELPALSSDVWDIVTVVLLDLVLREAVTTTTILQGLVYPAWQASAVVDDQQKVHQLQLHLVAANSLFERLLLQDDGGDTSDGGVLFADLLDIQRFVTRRQLVYRETHFPLLLRNIPTLVSMGGNPNLPEDMRTMACSIRLRVCQLDEFRQGVYRDLTEVREAFEQPLKAKVIPEGLHESLVAALRLIFDDGSSSTSFTQVSEEPS